MRRRGLNRESMDVSAANGRAIACCVGAEVGGPSPDLTGGTSILDGGTSRRPMGASTGTALADGKTVLRTRRGKPWNCSLRTIFTERLGQSHRLPAMIDVDVVIGRSLMTVHHEAGRLTTAVNPHGIADETSRGSLEAHFCCALELLAVQDNLLQTLVAIGIVDEGGEDLKVVDAAIDEVGLAIPLRFPLRRMLESKFAVSMLDVLTVGASGGDAHQRRGALDWVSHFDAERCSLGRSVHVFFEKKWLVDLNTVNIDRITL
ncbi:hypothetical protein HG531_007117 [Fusarium graminearum]|nr:hypothetical protein HG531_007117 [Fusarium graminearum]